MGSWDKLLRNLGKTKADNEPLSLLTILDSNGIRDALWVLSYSMPDDRLARHFQAWCAEQVLHLFEEAMPGDGRIRDQIAMLRNDGATKDERAAARTAARAAARDAERKDAWGTACGAARAAARDAACDTAFSVAIDAAWASARAAAWDSARAEQEQQLRLMIGADEVLARSPYPDDQTIAREWQRRNAEEEMDRAEWSDEGRDPRWPPGWWVAPLAAAAVAVLAVYVLPTLVAMLISGRW